MLGPPWHWHKGANVQFVKGCWVRGPRLTQFSTMITLLALSALYSIGDATVASGLLSGGQKGMVTLYVSSSSALGLVHTCGDMRLM